jgi:DNA primase
MSIDLERIRALTPIEQLVGEKFTLRRAGARFVGVEHDSLVVLPQSGQYFWNSRGEHGDVFDFVGRYLLNYETRWNPRDPAQFLEAVRYLAQRVGLPVEEGQAVKNRRFGRSASSSNACMTPC